MKKSLLLGIGALLSVSIWAQSIPDLPIAIEVGSAEVWGISTTVKGNSAFVYGGYAFGNNKLRIYNFVDNTWSQVATNEKGGSWLSSVVYQDEIYPVGWTNGLFYKYSPSSDQWTQLADLPYHVNAGGFDGSPVTIKKFNTLGIEIATLINESKPAGSYEINYNASALTS